MYCVCDNIVYVAFKELCKNLCDAVVITVIIVATSNQFTMQTHYFLELTAVFFACLSSFYPLLFPIAHYFLCVSPMCLCFVYLLGLEYCWQSLSLLVHWCWYCCFASFFFCWQFALFFVQLPAYAVCTVCQSLRCTRVTLHVKLIRFCNCKGEIVKIDN